MSNVTEFGRRPERSRAAAHDNGNGSGDWEGRLRSVEIQLAVIQERMENVAETMATKEDIEKLKNWILKSVLTLFLGLPAIAFFIVQLYNVFQIIIAKRQDLLKTPSPPPPPASPSPRCISSMLIWGAAYAHTLKFHF